MHASQLKLGQRVRISFPCMPGGGDKVGTVREIETTKFGASAKVVFDEFYSTPNHQYEWIDGESSNRAGWKIDQN